MKSKTYLITSILFLVVSLVSCSNDLKESGIKQVKIDKNFAPDFSLNSHDDNLYILSELKGKAVLLNFWATWCGPCRMEIPDFNELYKQYNDKGLEILSISISDSYQQLIKFKNAYNMFYPILYGDQKNMMKIQREYGGIHSIPMSFLINKKGEIIRVYPGAIIKQFDPNIYTDLILHIEDALLQ